MTTSPARQTTIREASPSPTSTPPTSPPPSGVTVPPLGVRPTPSTSTANGTDASGNGASAGAQQGPADPLDTDTRSESDGYGETPREAPEPIRLAKGSVEEVARGLVFSGTVLAHQTLARLPEEEAAGLWLLEDERQAAGIADPLARIAKRRAGGALINPDAGDLIAAGVAFAGYVLKNAAQAAAIRWSYRRARRAGIPTQQHEEQDDA